MAALHLFPPESNCSSGSYFCARSRSILLCNRPWQAALEGRWKVRFHWKFCQRVIFLSWSYQHTLNLNQWISSQQNCFSNPITRWWWTKKEKGQEPSNDRCWGGSIQGNTACMWKTDSKKSTLSGGKWFSVGSGTWQRGTAKIPSGYLCDLRSSHRRYLQLGSEAQLFSETWRKAASASLCVWTETTHCTAFHLKCNDSLL